MSIASSKKINCRAVTEDKELGRVNLVLVWHMHQPQYRDPVSGRYMLPWTRLHALKDYWGMVKVLGEFPGVHATFNIVPLLAAQIEEYASGKFREPWFEVAFAAADTLKPEQKRVILERAFQVNEIYVQRWPRFADLQAQVRSAGARGMRRAFQRTGLARPAIAFTAGVDGRGIHRQRSGGESAGGEGHRLHRTRQSVVAGETNGIAGRSAAGISHRGGKRANRNFHHSLLPSDSAALVRYGHRAQFPIRTRRCRSRRFAIRAMRVNSSCARENITSACSANRRQDCGPPRVQFPTNRWRLRRNWGSSGSRRTKVCWGAREISGSGAMRAAIRKMVRSFTRRGSCSAAARKCSGSSATIIFRTWWASFTAAWVRWRPRRICTAAFARSAIANRRGAPRR